ncbi:MAG: hypothetical protein C3F13_03250 [Anaerolineales bacterium]|nr:phosphatase PAP2 family protein [Anaerolineae bacterium]PWB55703.1 MAG: hypothetical protein C3F13_03250 [Anaerolineales bacterium]
MENFQGLSIDLIQMLQTLSPMLDGLFRFVYLFGTPAFYVLLIPIIYWTVNRNVGVTALMVFVSATIVSIAFRQLLHLPRPYWSGSLQVLAQASSYALPSSAAAISLAVMGYLAYRLDKAWLWASAGLLIILIGISGMYLGLHFPLDILTGWLLGLAVLVTLIKAHSFPLHAWNTHSIKWQVGVAFGLSLGVIGIGLLVHAWIAPVVDPVSWAAFTPQARSMGDYFACAGVLLGGVIGARLMTSSSDFRTGGTFPRKIWRCISGIAGVLFIYFGFEWLEQQLPIVDSAPGYALRYLEASLVMLWVFFFAPRLFLKIKLARPVKYAATPTFPV